MYRMFCLALLAFLGAGMMADSRGGCTTSCRMTANLFDCTNKACFGTTYVVCHYCGSGNLCSDALSGGYFLSCRSSTYANAWYWADTCSPDCSCMGVSNVSSSDFSGLDLLNPHTDVRSGCSLF
jgi:hypothetical protein